MQNKNRQVNKRVLTDEKLDEIGFRLEQSLQKPLRRLAQQKGVSKSSVQISDIRQEICNITQKELQKVSADVLKRCETCIKAGGYHFQHL